MNTTPEPIPAARPDQPTEPLPTQAAPDAPRFAAPQAPAQAGPTHGLPTWAPGPQGPAPQASTAPASGPQGPVLPHGWTGAPHHAGAAPAAAHPAGAPAPAYAATSGMLHGSVPPAHGSVPPPGGGTATGAPSGLRPRRGWVPVVGVAAAAAVLASVGTAGLLEVLSPETTQPTSLADVGQSTEPRTVPVANSTSENPNWEAVTKAVAPSVVAIEVQTQAGAGEGSGVVIDEKGHILTNNHVVEGAVGDTVQVTLNDGRLFEATIVGTDSTTDLAVVQIKDAPGDLVPASLGDSDEVSVGESVLAVGNPLGLANTATTGIVSAVDRPVSASGTTGGTSVVTNAIQIDAAVNPGNSGGPLFNAQGEVIGITSSIATMSSGDSQSGSIGLGFAIPVNLAKSIGEQLIADGTAEHAFLGVSLSDTTATADGVTRRGAKVEEVTEGSPAAEAGIKAGDVIVAIDGHGVGGAESLTAFVRERAAGAATTITLVRDGKAQDVDVTLAAKAADTAQQGSGDQGQQLPGQDPTDPNNVPNPDDWFFGGEG